ncbi:hypothetical protein MALG_02556 [Marinovum algicola DG 898]|nr:hypothetical protein MALG_02556 [Marinovum algicola DG 898]
MTSGHPGNYTTLTDVTRSSLLTPSRRPRSTSDCATHRRNDSRLHPIFGVIARIVADRSL